MAISKIACFLIYACIFAIAHLNKVGLEQNFFSLNKLLKLLLNSSFRKSIYVQFELLKKSRNGHKNLKQDIYGFLVKKPGPRF
jgi:hypothetical protein